MLGEAGAGGDLSALLVPPLQRFRCIVQVVIEADQQGSTAAGAGPLGAVAARGIRAVPGGRVMLLERPVPAAVGAVPDHLDHQTSSSRVQHGGYRTPPARPYAPPSLVPRSSLLSPGGTAPLRPDAGP